eukprot:CAMPEP_0116913582 /NCGR_PEP_ID=MMETSP0467-20121206/16788_1 /TAXON_ID=283647 /ORGANISM="Mesodinium pulex, Strain SPMC105" /LENGTH=81 /DNA_ID=CAMNT_0004589821 /DNA_START=944 /DNA_END=1189 /DNA_ORIENTATION=+
MDISDIEGSNSGSLHKTMFKLNPGGKRSATTGRRSDMDKVDNLDVSDIQGAQSGTRGKLKRVEMEGKMIENYEKMVNKSNF